MDVTCIQSIIKKLSFQDLTPRATESKKTLRAYSSPLRLALFERWGWQFNDEAMDRIAVRLDASRHHALLSARQIARLAAVDPRTYRGEMTGTDPAGLYRPGKKS